MKDKSELNIEIGKQIKIAREKVGYTQEKFAEKIDRSVQYISDLERGKAGPSIQTLIRICETLYVTPDFILLGKDSVPQNNNDIFQIPTTLTDEERKILNDGINVLLRAFSVK